MALFSAAPLLSILMGSSFSRSKAHYLPTSSNQLLMLGYCNMLCTSSIITFLISIKRSSISVLSLSKADPLCCSWSSCIIECFWVGTSGISVIGDIELLLFKSRGAMMKFLERFSYQFYNCYLLWHIVMVLSDSLLRNSKKISELLFFIVLPG